MFNNPSSPQVYDFNVLNGSTQDDEDNILDIDGVAVMAQILNRGETEVSVFLNDWPTPFMLEGGHGQNFNWGDLHLTRIAFSNTISGGQDAPIQIIVGVVNF